MSILTPQAWDGIGIVTFIIVVVVWLAVAFQRGWLVLGKHHEELIEQIVSAKDHAIAEHEWRAREDAKTINTMSQTLAEASVAGQLQAHVLEALKNVAETRS